MTALYNPAWRPQNERRQQYEHGLGYVAGYMAFRAYLKQQHHARVRRIYSQMTLNGTRRFAGSALPYTSGIGSVELSCYRANEYFHASEPASIYYTDIAIDNYRRVEQDRTLAAAVSYHNRSF